MAESEGKDQEVQEKYYYLQQLRNDSETVQNRISEVENARNELDSTIESLEYFSSLDGQVEALMNLGGGVFAYVDVKDSRKMLCDVGGGVVMEKEVDDAVESLKERREKLKENISNLENTFNQIVNEAEKVQQELTEMTREE
ncbi:MAG: prefoldin subunit alpha [Archaeoglobaceae archaeon]